MSGMEADVTGAFIAWARIGARSEVWDAVSGAEGGVVELRRASEGRAQYEHQIASGHQVVCPTEKGLPDVYGEVVDDILRESKRREEAIGADNPGNVEAKTKNRTSIRNVIHQGIITRHGVMYPR